MNKMSRHQVKMDLERLFNLLLECNKLFDKYGEAEPETIWKHWLTGAGALCKDMAKKLRGYRILRNVD